ncbi:MAG: hypothetical protein FWE42_04800 [Defluviitaleaceae bacterium]|nr:hypothetical protein [Defluviitaleaceae bacterium]
MNQLNIKIRFDIFFLLVLLLLLVLVLSGMALSHHLAERAAPATYVVPPPIRVPPPLPLYEDTQIPFFLRVTNPIDIPRQGVVFILGQGCDDLKSWTFVQTVSSDENGWAAFPPLSPLGTYRIINYYTPYPYRVVYGYNQLTVDYYGVPIWPTESLPIQPGRYTYLNFTIMRSFIL